MEMGCSLAPKFKLLRDVKISNSNLSSVSYVVNIFTGYERRERSFGFRFKVLHIAWPELQRQRGVAGDSDWNL